MNLSPFEEFDLSPELLKALEKKGYTRPTAIQLEAIPAAMEERDVLGSAPTGTGKTELAKQAAKQLFGSEEAMIRLDMSEYMTDNAVVRLIGNDERKVT